MYGNLIKTNNFPAWHEILTLMWQTFQFFCLFPAWRFSPFFLFEAKWFASNWSRVFGVLYQDSTFVWYESQMASRPEGIICLKLAPELIAVGQYSRRLFQVPILPSNGPVIENLIAFGERRKQRVYFFLPESQQEFKYVGGGQNFLSCCLWNRTLRQPIHCKLISV